MRRFDRIFVVVLDGVGAGELPDACNYGDTGSHTLCHIARAYPDLAIPNLRSIGLSLIHSDYFSPSPNQRPCAYGRMLEQSPGKDSVTGHWEMAGIVLNSPFPTYPNGFPRIILEAFEQAIGRKTIGNYPASGTEIIEALGVEHCETGYPIVYNSADSVFQIACHEEIVPLSELYRMSEIAREMLHGDDGVGRVIARPFVNSTTPPNKFRRTEGRKDFPLPAPKNLLDILSTNGISVTSIGKISEFFAGRGISTNIPTTNNQDHIQALQTNVESRSHGLVFANLEDFDMLFGHRNDVVGFANALETYDVSLGKFIAAMKTTDLLIITNDHGNDPTTPGTDHAREYAHLITYSPALKNVTDLGIRHSFSDIACTILNNFELPFNVPGTSFLPELI